MNAPRNLVDRVADVARKVAQGAGELLLSAPRGRAIEIGFKGATNLVTEYDVRIERYITETILSHFPDHSILGEELTSESLEPKFTRGPLWVVDPIDGTTNFAHHHHMVSISICFLAHGVPEVGIVHAPFLTETFFGRRGQGATLNGSPIRVSPTSLLRHSLIATGFPYEKEETIDLLLRRLRAVLTQCREIRRLGSAALDLCWVAMGRLEGYYESVSPWDMAAGALILREAGGTISHLTPCPTGFSLPQALYSRDLVASNGHIHSALCSLLEEASREVPASSTRSQTKPMD